MFVILLIILVCFHNAHSFNCIANSSFITLRSGLTSNNDSFTLQKIINKTIHSSTKSDLCHVTIWIDYNQTNGDVIIKFGRDTNRTIDYLDIETWFPLVKENSSIISYVDYACSLDDLCDQIFVEKWIQLFANIDYEPLQDKLIYLLASNIHSDKCDIAGKLAPCSSGMCIAEYNSNIDNPSLGTNCLENASMISTELYVKIQSIEFQPMQYEELSYICMSDRCNSASTFKHVMIQTGKFFNRISPVMEWLVFKNRMKNISSQMPTIIREVMNSISNRYATTSANDLSSMTLSFACICLLFCFICLCCCSRKPQEHLPTSSSI